MRQRRRGLSLPALSTDLACSSTLVRGIVATGAAVCHATRELLRRHTRGDACRQQRSISASAALSTSPRYAVSTTSETRFSKPQRQGFPSKLRPPFESSKAPAPGSSLSQTQPRKTVPRHATSPCSPVVGHPVSESVGHRFHSGRPLDRQG